MTNATISVVRDALAAKMSEIDGLRGIAIVDSEINPPVAVVVPGSISTRGHTVVEYDSTFANGSHCYYFTVQIAVSTVVNRTAQALVDEYISPDGTKSIKTVLENDMTLGGLVSWAKVISCSHYGMTNWNSVQYLGASLIVEVMT